MIKKFLYMLLIVMSSNVICSDASDDSEPSLTAAIEKGEKYFMELTPSQLAAYEPEVNESESPEEFLPIETAAMCGNIPAVNWLLSNNAILSTAVLSVAVYPRFLDDIKPEIVSALLARGAIIDGLIIHATVLAGGAIPDGIKVVDINRLRSRLRNKSDESVKQTLSKIDIIDKMLRDHQVALKEHEAASIRWSPFREAFCIAAVRAGQEIKRRDAAYKSAASAVTSLLGMPAVGAPSNRVAELK